MAKIYLKSRSDEKTYSADKGNFKFEVGDLILLENETCQEIGQIIEDQNDDSDQKKEFDEAVIIRRVNDKDKEIDSSRKKEAVSYIEKCKKIILKHQLPMEIIDADISFDDKKLTFYFSAPNRIDFRILVSELASTFQRIIRLQQVGARNRARCAGGVGRCGLDFCCKKFLKGELDCISTDMAYDQNIGQMGPNRVTGACGKLMCCLKYELDFYKDRKKKMPEVGKTVKTKKGEGIVIGQNIIKNMVTVQLKDKTILEVNC